MTNTSTPPEKNPQRDAPAFDFYPERWLVGVATFSDAEQLAYLRLLCHQWMLQGLPAELPALRRLAGRGVSEALLEKFPLSPDGKRRNARLETIRTEQRKRIASNQYRAARGAWVKHNRGAPYPDYLKSEAAYAAWKDEDPHCSSTAQALLEHCLNGAHHPPPTTHPVPVQEAAREPAPVLGESDEGPSGGSDPVSIPPVTMEQAKQAAPQMGVSAEAAEAWWLDHDARGWLDARGQPVRNWRSSLTAYGRRWQANESRRPAGSAGPASHALPPSKPFDLF